MIPAVFSSHNGHAASALQTMTSLRRRKKYTVFKTAKAISKFPAECAGKMMARFAKNLASPSFTIQAVALR
jgi:hypothetical protein